jgi:prevent-host-death family protein
MTTVRIAELKAKLSEYLRRVRRGQPVTVLDRDTPVAKIVPYESEAGELVIRRASGKIPFGKVPLPPPYKTEVDIVRLLLEERQTDR